MNNKQRVELVNIAKAHKDAIVKELDQVNGELLELQARIRALEARAKKLKTDIVLIDMALANTLLP